MEWNYEQQKVIYRLRQIHAKWRESTQKLKVGEFYKNRRMVSGTSLQYDPMNGFTLAYVWPEITTDEEKSFKHGEYLIALVDLEDHFFIMSAFEPSVELLETPFHAGLDNARLFKDNSMPNLPDHIDDGKLKLNVLAVDIYTKKIVAVRFIYLSTALSKVLIKQCSKQQQDTSLQPHIHFHSVDSVQRKYSAEQIYEHQIIECRG